MNGADAVIMWVVYKVTIRSKPGTLNAVCEQAEWDAMEQGHPGEHTLIRAGIMNEAEAELLARGTSGDAKIRRSSAGASRGPATTA
jgi:hypothetical protein